MLWFAANYFAMACLQYTTVASATILTSTSSIWTLLIGACTHTERFTLRKLFGVLASFIGIVLVSHADLSTTRNRPSTSPSSSAGTPSITNPFPAKPASELFLGDTLAFLSAIIYGAYTITLKRTTLRCAPLKLNMPLFFALVGLCNALLLFPLFPLLHYTHIERFQLPPTPRIWKILIINSAFSLFSDICWAYAMVLTSPLVVTVGLSLTIPLSLVGEMVLQGRKEGLIYWLGALVVVGSFVFVDREEVKEEKEGDESLDTSEALCGSEVESVDTYSNPGRGFRSSEDLPR
jgi:solute carrier family 35, member F5